MNGEHMRNHSDQEEMAYADSYSPSSVSMVVLKLSWSARFFTRPSRMGEIQAYFVPSYKVMKRFLSLQMPLLNLGWLSISRENKFFWPYWLRGEISTIRKTLSRSSSRLIPLVSSFRSLQGFNMSNPSPPFAMNRFMATLQFFLGSKALPPIDTCWTLGDFLSSNMNLMPETSKKFPPRDSGMLEQACSRACKRTAPESYLTTMRSSMMLDKKEQSSSPFSFSVSARMQPELTSPMSVLKCALTKSATKFPQLVSLRLMSLELVLRGTSQYPITLSNFLQSFQHLPTNSFMSTFSNSCRSEISYSCGPSASVAHFLALRPYSSSPTSCSSTPKSYLFPLYSPFYRFTAEYVPFSQTLIVLSLLKLSPLLITTTPLMSSWRTTWSWPPRMRSISGTAAASFLSCSLRM